MAGTIGLVQNDIKRVLAYSTVSQLGYMFLAMGVGAFGAGIFHLYTHAFFKALLFLGSGAVIHALHGEQDIRNMGGLKKHLPITYWTFVIGVAGDCRRAAARRASSRRTRFCSRPSLAATSGCGSSASLTSLLTATYMWRLVHLTFHGRERFAASTVTCTATAPRSDHRAGIAARCAAGDGDRAVVLAIGSVLAGYVGIPHALGGHNELGTWLEPSFEALGRALAGMTLGDCAPTTPAAEAAGLAGIDGRRLRAGSRCGAARRTRLALPAAGEAPSTAPGQPASREARRRGALSPTSTTRSALELLLMARVERSSPLLGIGSRPGRSG